MAKKNIDLSVVLHDSDSLSDSNIPQVAEQFEKRQQQLMI